jgi:hypothetical protein
MLRRAAICVAAIILSASCASSRPIAAPHVAPSDAAKMIAEVEGSEEARRRAAGAGDYETAMQYIAPEFFFVHSTGQVDDVKRFREFSERVAGGKQESPRQLEKPTYAVHGDVVVRTRLTSAPLRPNQPHARSRSLDVFIRQSGTWRWLAHQGTQVLPPWREVPAPAALAEYAGTYVAENGQARVFTAREKSLVQAPIRDGAAEVTLRPLSESTFAIPDTSNTVTFLRDRSGRVAVVQVVGPLGLSVFSRQ